MKSEMEIIEDYIDYNMEREFVESLTIEEQVLYKCQLRETISFTVFSLFTRFKEFFGKSQIIAKINELSWECNNDFCEWELDGVYLRCQHKTELFVSCLAEEKYRYKYCPICGKEIKAVEHGNP